MNKTENKTKTEFSNIREMQNLVKTNSINSFAMNLKSSKQKLSGLGVKILELKKASETKIANEKQEKVLEKKVETTVVSPKIEETKIVMQKTQLEERQPKKDNFNQNRQNIQNNYQIKVESDDNSFL